jgi:para-aminobenzoate synthetase/4-amino-4-deoxychorismate lyase
MLSPRSVDSSDPFLYYKTTRRWLYEAELSRLQRENPAVFDLLFRNERGELTEGARSNLFLEFGPHLHTPPVSAGLLNGVMRRHLIARGRPTVVERTLYPADLERADRVYVANAVRGLQQAEVVRASLPRENGIRRND